MMGSKRSRTQSHAVSGTSKATSTRARQKLKEKDNPTLGIIYFIIYCFLNACSYVFVEELYERQPTLSPWQMFFMRSVMGIGIMSVHLNINLKKETWD